MNDPVALCAEAVAAWHASWLAALGIRSERDGAVWRTLEAPPNIYFAAITLRPEAGATAVASAPGSICDSWQSIELEPLGFKVWRRDSWYHRPASSVYGTEPPELDLSRVTTEADVAELSSSEEGERLYRGLGFHRVGELSIWVREGPVP